MSFTVNYFYILASIMLTGYFLAISKTLFNPLLTAFLLALALKPLATKIEQLKIPRLGSTLVTVLFFILIFLGLLIFFSTQLGRMNFEVNTFGENLNGISGKIQNWITELSGINSAQQIAFLKNSFNNILQNSTSFINHTLSATTGFLTSFVIFIISLFFFLYYRAFLVHFLYKIFSPVYHLRLAHTLQKMQIVVSGYIFGLSLVIVIVAILNIIGLLLLGIEHAVLFGVLAAVLTLIPYIGILLGALLPTLFALITKDSVWYSLAVVMTFMFIQFLEGNVLTPNIVGRQVRINPFAAILGLLIGGMILGLIGVMVALPVLAICKVICDEVVDLQPVGYLIGSETAECAQKPLKTKTRKK